MSRCCRKPNKGRTAALRRVWTFAGAAVLLGACGDAAGPADARDFAATGTVFMVGGGVPPGLTVSLVSGTTRVTAPVAPNGTFSVDAAVATDSVDLIIDEDALNRTVLPSLIRLPSRTPVSGVRVLLVPRNWTVTEGTYAGQTVRVSLDDAFRPPCVTPGDINCDGFYPAVWNTGIKLWPVIGFPVPVAFDHARSHQPVTAVDSAVFWTTVGRMNADLGATVFRPARAAELGLQSDGRPSMGVVLRVDTTLAGFGAWTNWWWNAGGDMYAGLIRTRTASSVRSPSLMTHELMHTQGFKHSCSWSTVMGGYGCGSTQGVSQLDVAYAQLARAVRDAERAAGAHHGLIAALQGERVVLRGLPVLSAGPVDRLRALRGDSIGEMLRGAAHAHGHEE